MSCETSNFKTADFGSFEMEVPTKWIEYQFDGTDSYVGGLITDDNDTLIYDLGWYSQDVYNRPELLVYYKSDYDQLTNKQKNKLENIDHYIITDYKNADYDPKDYLANEFEIDSVDCFKAVFVRTKNDGFGISGIYIDSLKGSKAEYDKTKFNFYGQDLSEKTQEEFIKALKTLDFKNYCK